MNTQLFVPKKIKVGYVERNDTYTKKLGYVIYYDNKNVLRKETSWNSWRNKNIPFDDFDNIPTSGFVLNKKVGGNSNYSWNQRQTYSRVYDPRGFEFEISIPNLLFILQECNCSKGKGLEGEFVYSWEGKELVLLPAQSIEYKQCLEYTELQSESIKAKDLKIGFTYMDNKQNQYVYLGRYNIYEYYDTIYNVDEPDRKSNKQHIFININDVEKENNENIYLGVSSVNKIKKELSDKQIDNFSYILQNFIDSPFVSEFSHYDYVDITKDRLTGEYSLDVYHNITKQLKRFYYSRNEKSYQFINGAPITVDEIIRDYKFKSVVFKNNSRIINY